MLLFVFALLSILLLSSLSVSANIVIEKEGVTVTIDPADFESNPELRRWFNDFMLDENYQIVRTEVDEAGNEKRVIADKRLETLQGSGAVAVSGLQVGRNAKGSYASITQFLSAVVIFVLVAVPLIVLGYEISRKKND